MFHSINQLINHAVSLNTNKPAFSLKTGFRTKTYTYQEVQELIKRFPKFFSEENINEGDKIIILSLNRPEYAMVILGALCCGVILIPIDYRTNHETILRFIKETKPKAIFTLRIFKHLFRSLSLKTFYFEDLITQLEEYPISELPEQPLNHLAAILFTSGTTGEPKGTTIAYTNILASINGIDKVFFLPRQFRILSILPLSHALEMFGGLLVTFSLGCHIHYIERINSITIVQALRRYKIQGMAVVPQMLRLLLQNVERKLKEDKKESEWNQAQKIAPILPLRLRRLLFQKLHQNLGGEFSLFVCGSAPLEPKLAQIWQNTGIKVLEGYGASETTGFVSTNTLKSNKIGSVGKIIPSIKYKINGEGELFVAGENIASGYFENPEKTSESFQNGWFNTGDIVEFDKDGFMKIVGRDKFKIVLSDGKKVYPEDIERKLNNNTYVLDSTVFGLSTETGEIVHAELILKDKSKVKDVIAKVNEKLNPHEQILDYGIWEEDDFPRTKTLKVDREAVRNAVGKRSSGKHANQKEEKEDRLMHILKEISGAKNKIEDSMVLTSDLKLDSLKRIELLALIEEEIGVSIDELKINSQTTVLDLRSLIKVGKPVMIEDGEKLASWQFTPFVDSLRVLLQDFLAFPVFNIGFKVKLIHPENIKKIKTPHLFIFNHVGVHDVMNILRILPKDIRKKTAIAATSQIWHEALYERYFSAIFGNAFPFVKTETHNAMRGNFDRVGELLDRGYNILISPEGNITHTGELLPFHTGAGYIAIEMGVPVTPFKIVGYYDLWPEKVDRKLNMFWPIHFGKVKVIVGEPIVFKYGASYEEATKTLRKIMLELT